MTKKILVSIQDFTSKKTREEITGMAIKWLESIDEKPSVALLHVVDEAVLEQALVSGSYIGTGAFDTRTLRKTLKEESMKKGFQYLKELKQDFVSKGYNTHIVLKVGDPVSTILNEARVLKASTILMVECHKSVLSAIFGGDAYGGICNKIVQKSSLPVVVITPKSIRFTDMGKKRAILPRLNVETQRSV